jgi:ABC-type uncharacterized transport system ATPase subunit
LPLARTQGITKRFGRVTVLHEVQFEIRSGEVHALAGENGAGKSTLIKILAGIHTDFDEQIEIAGRPAREREAALRITAPMRLQAASLDRPAQAFRGFASVRVYSRFLSCLKGGVSQSILPS